MAVREIKTSIVLDGEQQFRQAIAAANKELRVSQSELKAVASAYDLSSDRMTMLANKQRSLGDMVNQQENITNALRRNLKELEQAYERAGRGVEGYRQKLRQAEESGDQSEIEKATKALRNAEIAYERAGSKVQDYRIQVNNAEDKLNKFKRSAQDVDREIEELGRDSVKAGRQIEDGIGDSAEEAEKDVRSLVQTLKDDLSSIRASTTFTAIGSLWDMATDAYSSVSGFVSGTQEYRKQLSFLQQNAESYDIDFSFIKDQLIETQVLTGDASSAVEGLSNLLSAEMDTKQITEAVDLLAGAVIKFPDTLKFESLADGLQETIATGEATGAFAESLGRLGVDVDDFNSALEKSETKAGDIEVALAYLSEHGLKNVYEQWKATNEEMVGSLETQAAIELELAEFGETLEQYIVTPVQEKLLEVLKWVNKEVDAWEASKTLEQDVDEKVKKGELSKNEGQAIKKGLKMQRNSQKLFAFGDAMDRVGEALGISENRGWEEYAYTKYNDTQDAARNAVQTIFANWVSPEKTEEAGKEAAQSFLTGWETMEMRPEEAVEAEGFKEAGENAGEALSDGFMEKMESEAEQARFWGEMTALNFGAGLASKVSYVAAQAANLAAAVARMAPSARAGGTVQVALNVDGRQMATALAPYNSEVMAVTMDATMPFQMR